MTREGRGEANGKVILLGEHVVVYGAPALAAGVDRGARAVAREASTSALHLGGSVLGASAESEDDRERAFAALLDAAPIPFALDVQAESDLAAGGGLGSSAALGVAIARAIAEITEGGEIEALTRASAWERVFHGNPSGIDTTAAARGGVFRFTRQDGPSSLRLAADLVLCVGWSGSSSSTRAMVEGLARLRDRQPKVVQQAIDGVRALVENGALALEAGDLAAFGKLMDLNQMILAGLMLSTEAIERLCALARGAGALGAKLTGAGGGGSVIALVAADDGASASVLEAWKREGFEGFATVVRAPRLAFTLRGAGE